jgi:hypothetical protein
VAAVSVIVASAFVISGESLQRLVGEGHPSLRCAGSVSGQPLSNAAVPEAMESQGPALSGRAIEPRPDRVR